VQNSFVIDHTSSNTFANKSLLLDTNILIDAYRLPVEFYDLQQSLVASGCDLVAIKSVIIEFLGGTKDKDKINDKVLFLESLFGKKLESTYLPLERDKPAISNLLEFGRHANKFSVPDYELYCSLKKYGKNIALVTRNHKDFPASLVNRISFITLLGKAEIHTYGIYTA